MGTQGSGLPGGFSSSGAKAQMQRGLGCGGRGGRGPTKLSGEEFLCCELSSPVPGGTWQSSHLAGVGPDGAPATTLPRPLCVDPCTGAAHCPGFGPKKGHAILGSHV